MRISSMLMAALYLLVGGYLARATAHFAIIFADLFGPDASLPQLTRMVLSVKPAGWIGFAGVTSVFFLLKDFIPIFRKLPVWPFAFALFLLIMIATVALFRPLQIIIVGLICP